MLEFYTTKLSTSLTKSEENELITLLRKNIDIFACTTYYMLEIDIRVVCQLLSINSSMKQLVPRKLKSR